MNTHTTQTTHCFTLQQLRAATQAGGVAGVSLKAQGSGFFIQIQLRTGQHAVLVTARSRSPRMFKNPAQAFGVLKRVGIVTGSFDMTHYSPEQHQTDNDTKQKEKKPPVKAAKNARAKKEAPTPSATSQTVTSTTTQKPPVAAPHPTQETPTTVTPPPPPPVPAAPRATAPQTTPTEAEKNTALGVQQSLI